jgi:hypothetical protein
MKTLAGWAYRRVPEDPLSDPPGGETTYEWTSPLQRTYRVTIEPR